MSYWIFSWLKNEIWLRNVDSSVCMKGMWIQLLSSVFGSQKKRAYFRIMTFLFFLIFEGSSQQFIPLNLWWKVVSRPANEALIVPFSLEEIWRAIKSLGKKRLLGLRRLWTFLGVLNLNGTQLEGMVQA